MPNGIKEEQMKQNRNLVIDYYELAEELNISKNAARKVINDTIRQLKANGAYIIPCRPPKASRQAVYELLGLEEKQ